MERAFALGQEVDEATAQAKYNDGVLELTLPKKAAAATKEARGALSGASNSTDSMGRGINLAA